MGKRSSTSSAIVRAIGLFSGVKIVTILCSLIRNKLIAWLIGPAGIGLVILFNSITDLVGSVTRLSIDQSVQRDISQARGNRCEVTVTVVRRWAVWLGLLGTVIMCVLSPLLSWWSFETTSRWPVFCLLSVVPMFITIANCSISINQALRRFGAVAKGTVAGAVAGLAMAVPLIIWLRIDSIVWVIVSYGVCAVVAAWIFRARMPKADLSVRQIATAGRPFLKLGANITLALFMSQAMSYAFVLFMNNYASTSTLGIYQAGYTLVNTYVGVVLAGIWMEYYPRIASMAHSARRTSIAASHEISVTLLALMPILSAFIALADPIIRLIYSSDFLAGLPFVTIGAIGVILRSVSWCVAYIILARGDGRMYLLTESLSCIIGLSLNIGGYLLGGFTGLGISYVLWYGTYTAIVIVVCRRRYEVKLTPSVCRLTVIALAVVVVAFFAGRFTGPILPLLIAAVSAYIAYRQLKFK